jgi:hypothetical protein
MTLTDQQIEAAFDKLWDETENRKPNAGWESDEAAALFYYQAGSRSAVAAAPALPAPQPKDDEAWMEIVRRHGELRTVDGPDYAEVFDAHDEKVALTTRPDLILALQGLAGFLAGGPVDEVVRLITLPAPPKAPEGAEWRPTHRHVHTGREFRMIGVAMLETAKPVTEATALIVYRDAAGDLWARPRLEFGDGRFEAIPAAPVQPKTEEE